MSRLPAGYSRPVKIGEGGFGTVFRVRDDAADRHVALKRLARGTSARSEAGLLARGIPCLPALHSIVAARGTEWICMEYIHGLPLGELVRLDPGPEELEAVAVSLVRSLGALHRAGIPHGDLKPDNVLVEPSGSVRLLDLGFSGATVAGGTAGYAAPEAGTPGADPFRCDLWSLGQILHELLAGARAGTTDRRSGWARIEAASPAWKAAVRATLEEDPSARPANADLIPLPAGAPAWPAALGERILSAADRRLASRLARRAADLVESGRPAEAMPLLQESLDLDPDQSESLELLPRVRISPRRPRWPWAAAAALAAAGAVAFWLAVDADRPDPSLPDRVEKDRLRPSRGSPATPPVPLREGGH